MWRRPLEWNLNGTTDPRDGSVDHLSLNSLRDRHGPIRAPKSLCVNIPAARKQHYLQLEVGHYGVFNGSRFREEIAPRIRKFIARIEEKP